MPARPIVVFFILIAIVVMPLFAHLDSFPIAQWDEARVATNSLEMSHSNNWIVSTFEGQPEMWNTKPPLLLWMQAIMLKVLGTNELAIRLPSALAALGTCLLLFFFFAGKYKKPWLGLISAAVLVTSPGYIVSHCARSGDYDSLLTMLMAGYAIFYFLYIEEGKRKYLLLTFIMLILAGLTKGVQALVFLPALFIYTIYKKKVMNALKQKEFYIGIAGFILFVIGYYLLREHYNPGYIAAVKQNELGGRFNAVLDNHGGDGFTFFYWITDTQFHCWYLFLLPGLLCGIFSSHKWLRDFTVYATLLIVGYFTAISNAQTKLEWYSMPLFPFLCVLVAIFIYSCCKLLVGLDVLKQVFRHNPLPYILIFFLFTAPYRDTIHTVLAGREGSGETREMRQMELFLQDVLYHRRNIDGYSIIKLRILQQLGWYYEAFDYQRRPIKEIELKDVSAGSIVITYDSATKKFLEANYNTQIMQSDSCVVAYKLTSKNDTGVIKGRL